MTTIARSDRSLIAEWYRTVDWPTLAACGMLLMLGLMLSLSAGPPAADRMGYADSFRFVWRHGAFVILAAACLVATSLLDAKWARRVAGGVFILAFLLMAGVLLFGHEAKGAQRWLRFAGFSLQPSELVKPSLIVLAGWLLAQRQLYPNVPWAKVAFGLYALTLCLLLLQPDVGQAFLLTAAFMVTFFVSGLPWRWAAGFAGGGVALSGLLFLTLPHVRFRILSFISPSAYDTYQVDVARRAIANGGVFGVGPGEGTIKTALPDAHTDFVFAVMSEEFGVILAFGVLALYLFIVARGILQAAQVQDPYRRAAATGLFAVFGLQAAINIGVNVGLMPPKGMTLPFLSYGGSSMLGSAVTLGLALALVRRRGARLRFRSAYA
ncbi:MAG: putative peptidoglycan glycosyltransferase FtsW [Pseudomonadota bacterium]